MVEILILNTVDIYIYKTPYYYIPNTILITFKTIMQILSNKYNKEDYPYYFIDLLNSKQTKMYADNEASVFNCLKNRQ